ncbi:MAG: hypothetical protein WCF04_09885 [Candidatus Nanopelagicales bacterium]
MPSRQVCPFHTYEDVVGELISGPKEWPQYSFTCPLAKGHPGDLAFSWLSSPEPEGGEPSGLTAELGLAVELPAALAQFGHRWVEYGVLERAYALARPQDFALLVERYGHTAVKAKRYTASSFLGRALGELSVRGALAFQYGPATGRWSYNSKISWWCLPPAPEWSPDLSWASLEEEGVGMDYVPGSTE